MASPGKELDEQENIASQTNQATAAVQDLAKEAKVGRPKAARSAFMCFSDAKGKEIAGLDGNKHAKKSRKIMILAEAWKALSSRERAYWDEVARDDKLRFVREKAAYKGPWEVTKRRAKKHPLAPKRPMSAFLKFSQNRRGIVKKQYPDMENTDVSRLLGEMWKEACHDERASYIEQEERERAIYKREIAKFRSEQARLDAASRTSHQTVRRMVAQPNPHQQPSSLSHNFGRVDSLEETGSLLHEHRLLPRDQYYVPYPSYQQHDYSSVASYSVMTAPSRGDSRAAPRHSSIHYDIATTCAQPPASRYHLAEDDPFIDNSNTGYYAGNESYFGRYR